jgi:FtsZ-interacting cell division protein ZipA
MSELQIVLLLVGVLVIVGVILYNRVQEARFRQRAETAFAQPSGDALLENGAARERIEPQFQDDAPAEPAGPTHRQEPRAMPDPASAARERAVEAALGATEGGAWMPPPRAPSAPESTAAKPVAPAPAAKASEPGLSEASAPPSAPSALPPQATEAAPVAAPPPALDAALAKIAYVVQASATEPFLPSVLDQLARALGPLAVRVQLLGRQKDSDAWETVDVNSPKPVRQLHASLLLVDRRGAVTQQDIVIFQSAIARCAAASGASAEIPDASAFVARSRELDGFCADVDVVVGINLVAQPGRPFAGTRLRGLAEAAGFRLERGAFIFPDGHGGARFTLEQPNGGAITPESLRTLQAGTLTLLLDVPRLADGVAAFDQMVAVGRQLAQSLGASLVDDNQVPVSEAGLEQIRNQLRSIYTTMETQGIPAGSPAALRLFS